METLPLLLIVFVSCILGVQSNCSSCRNIGGQTVECDSSCANGGLGCNAGGLGQNCRFCGFQAFPPCKGNSGSPPQPRQEPRDRTPSTSGNGHRFTVRNNCPFTVWAGAYGRGFIPFGGGFTLARHASKSFVAPRHWTAARIWGRTGCRNVNGRFVCDTGDCGGKLKCNGATGVPPCTLAEFTLDAHGSQDFYDVSNVDGYNLPMRIDVSGDHERRSGYKCSNAGCVSDLNSICPSPLRVVKHGRTIACKSACARFNEDRYCCRNSYGTPDKCPPTNYSRVFKQACPKAYSYAYDDKASTFTCRGRQTDYTVTFCP